MLEAKGAPAPSALEDAVRAEDSAADRALAEFAEHAQSSAAVGAVEGALPARQVAA